MKTLPFNFERLSNQTVFLSNVGGFSETIASDQLDLLIKDIGQMDPAVTNALSGKLFLASEEDYKVKRLALASAFGKRLTADMQFRPVFMFVPTLRCDHTCSYCQVARAPIHQSQFDMTEEVLRASVTRMLNLARPPYTIEIQGGEPLLRFDLIKLLYDLCIDKISETDFSIVITSSLSLLTREMVDWASTRQVSFSMSLDGLAHIHDKHRILATDSSHRRAMLGAKLIQAELGHDRLGFVTTVTKDGLDDPAGLIRAHQELDTGSFFVRPLSPYGFARKKGMGSYTLTEYFDFYRAFLRLLKTQWSAGFSVTEHSLGVHVKRLQMPNYNAYADLKSPSGFGLNSILFNYEGSIFGSDEARMLQRVHPEIDFSFGSVTQDELTVSAINRATISGGINLNNPGCSTCAYQPFCGADPLQSLSLFGEPVGHKAQSPFCEYHKSMFALALKYLNGSDSDRAFAEALAN